MSSPAEQVEDTMVHNLDLSSYGIENAIDVLHNPDYDCLYAEETASGLGGYEAGKITESGAVAVDTGIFTGRSPRDKYLVRDEVTRDNVWWADQGDNDNNPIDNETWQSLKQLVSQQLSGKRLFVVDTYCGANPPPFSFTFKYQTRNVFLQHERAKAS